MKKCCSYSLSLQQIWTSSFWCVVQKESSARYLSRNDKGKSFVLTKNNLMLQNQQILSFLIYGYCLTMGPLIILWPCGCNFILLSLPKGKNMVIQSFSSNSLHIDHSLLMVTSFDCLIPFPFNTRSFRNEKQKILQVEICNSKTINILAFLQECSCMVARIKKTIRHV